MPPTTENTHRVNDQIRITPIRVVDQDGEMLGIIPTAEALKTAAEAGMDLVEVAPNERPPVCRIMDYGKFKYEQTKKKKDAQKTHQVQVKEIRLRPKTGEHDIEFKVKRARSFLDQKDKVKINVIFRGRENAHHNRGPGDARRNHRLPGGCGQGRKSPRHGKRPDHERDPRPQSHQVRTCFGMQAEPSRVSGRVRI